MPRQSRQSGLSSQHPDDATVYICPREVWDFADEHCSRMTASVEPMTLREAVERQIFKAITDFQRACGASAATSDTISMPHTVGILYFHAYLEFHEKVDRLDLLETTLPSFPEVQALLQRCTGPSGLLLIDRYGGKGFSYRLNGHIDPASFHIARSWLTTNCLYYRSHSAQLPSSILRITANSEARSLAYKLLANEHELRRPMPTSAQLHDLMKDSVTAAWWQELRVTARTCSTYIRDFLKLNEFERPAAQRPSYEEEVRQADHSTYNAD